MAYLYGIWINMNQYEYIISVLNMDIDYYGIYQYIYIYIYYIYDVYMMYQPVTNMNQLYMLYQ